MTLFDVGSKEVFTEHIRYIIVNFICMYLYTFVNHLIKLSCHTDFRPESSDIFSTFEFTLKIKIVCPEKDISTSPLLGLLT